MISVAVVVAVLLVGTLVALAAFVRVEVVFDGTPTAQVRWLALGLFVDGGAREARLTLFSRQVLRKPLPAGAEPEARESRGLRALPHAIRAVRREGGNVRRAVVAFVRRVTWERLELDAEFGASDPALTGMLYGLACAVVHPLPTGPNVQVRLDPDFHEERFDGRFESTFAVRTSHLLAFGLRMVRIGLRSRRAGRNRKESRHGRNGRSQDPG